MNQTVKYTGNQKTFYVPKKRLKLKKEVRLFFLLLFFLISLALFFVFLNASYTSESEMKIINYQEIGKVDYEVYTKQPNSQYGPILSSGGEYVASVVDYFKIGYDYGISASEEINYKYTYQVISTLKIFRQNAMDSGITLYEEEKVLINQEVDETDINTYVKKYVDINYDEYNQIVDEHKNEHAISVDAYVDITFKVNVTGKDDEISRGFTTNHEMNVRIPLSEQTVLIEQTDNYSPEPTYFNDFDEIEITNYFMFALTLITGLSSIFWAVLFGLLLHHCFFKKDIYTKTIRKYLREYDRLIVTSAQPDLDESSFVNKIRVMSIEELIDAHDSTGAPIIYYEVVPNEKSYFIIINGNTFYKLTISKVYLEAELEEKKQNA